MNNKELNDFLDKYKDGDFVEYYITDDSIITTERSKIIMILDDLVKKLMLTDVGVPKGTLCDKPETNKEEKYYARWTKNSKPEDFA